MQQRSETERELLRSVFGSDSEEDDERVACTTAGAECVLPGCVVLRGWLPDDRQQMLLQSLQSAFEGLTLVQGMAVPAGPNQGMRFFGSEAQPAWFCDICSQVTSIFHFSFIFFFEEAPSYN